MRYVSTRGQSEPARFFEAFANGLAPDGGLYVPEEIPSLSEDTVSGEAVPYPALALEVLRLFDTDHTDEDLFRIIDRSYSNFTDLGTAPLKQLAEKLWVLELFHGPTLSFKDFGLQLVGNLFEDQIKRTGNSINILGATSGDTGSAAIHGLANKEGVNVFILYPSGRISKLQERQMTCTGAKNVFPIPVEGTFDDAQRIVKELLGNQEFRKQTNLSAINSINLARVLAQSVYYLHAFTQLPAADSDGVQFVVPTGNFGNVFAGWLASEMGVPCDRLVVATNQNDLLYRLFKTGVYEPGKVVPSHAPSMDIQVASNFERILYYQLNRDGKAVAELMKTFKQNNRLELPNFNSSGFTATRSSDADILANIKHVYDKYNYIVDPHTACGFQEIDPEKNTIVLSTAHPAKFPETIHEAIGIHPKEPSLEALREKRQVRYDMEATVEAVEAFILLNGAL